jgi:hypothetical protein
MSWIRNTGLFPDILSKTYSNKKFQREGTEQNAKIFTFFNFVFHIWYLKCALYFSNLQTKKHFANMETQKDSLTWRSRKTLLSEYHERLSYLEIKTESLTWILGRFYGDQERFSYLEVKMWNSSQLKKRSFSYLEIKRSKKDSERFSYLIQERSGKILLPNPREIRKDSLT